LSSSKGLASKTSDGSPQTLSATFMRSMSGMNESNGHNPNAGPQPLNIAATPDAIKIRGKFIAPQKKTGMPEASPIKPATKSATKKVTKKTAARKSKKSA
jgi:hypothetical protein